MRRGEERREGPRDELRDGGEGGGEVRGAVYSRQREPRGSERWSVPCRAEVRPGRGRDGGEDGGRRGRGRVGRGETSVDRARGARAAAGRAGGTHSEVERVLEALGLSLAGALGRLGADREAGERRSHGLAGLGVRRRAGRRGGCHGLRARVRTRSTSQRGCPAGGRPASEALGEEETSRPREVRPAPRGARGGLEDAPERYPESYNTANTEYRVLTRRRKGDRRARPPTSSARADQP